jgi:transposase-like protein
MRTGRPVKPLLLDEEDKAKLLMLARRPKTDQRTALRARIVLACAEGLNIQRVAAKLQGSPPTLSSWRRCATSWDFISIPPEQTRVVVLCVDEKSQVQALDRSQPVLAMRLGQAERHTHDYYRHGTTSLFAELDIATGKVLGRCHRQHRQKELVRFLDHIEANVPRGLGIHLVVDNYATHKTPKVAAWLKKRPRYHLHFTPTNKPFVWTASADLILGRVERLCKRINNSPH